MGLDQSRESLGLLCLNEPESILRIGLDIYRKDSKDAILYELRERFAKNTPIVSMYFYK